MDWSNESHGDYKFPLLIFWFTHEICIFFFFVSSFSRSFVRSIGKTMKWNIMERTSNLTIACPYIYIFLYGFICISGIECVCIYECLYWQYMCLCIEFSLLQYSTYSREIEKEKNKIHMKRCRHRHRHRHTARGILKPNKVNIYV